MDYDDYCDQFEAEGARFVASAHAADVAAPVPGCPQWCVADLLAHVGFVHRWARYLVAARASERVSARDMNLSRGPVTSSWLAQGVHEALATLRESDPNDVMWAWGADQHVRFWARRLLHETLVHRVDLEEAMGVTSQIDAHIAIDAIDEFLANLERAGVFSPDVKNLVGTGEVITFRVDEGPSWQVLLTPGGFELLQESRHADAIISGSARNVLLTLYRRAPAGSSCEVSGRVEVIEKWLENCALQ
ncbi:MAG: maleylpyruvate isomerase family mycothiol-dependent enzyme [Acidimicrobiaceae bacterium]|nr:maleylpyruvate isomerase family mycothiol-dependent enzyme [Acidimicrobiaceae bacterium]